MCPSTGGISKSRKMTGAATTLFAEAIETMWTCRRWQPPEGGRRLMSGSADLVAIGRRLCSILDGRGRWAYVLGDELSLRV